MRRDKNKPENKPIGTYFRGRVPFGNSRPVDYEEYEPFVSFKPIIDGYLEKLFAAGSALDEGNKDVVDPLIADMATKAEQHLEQQRIDHANSLNAFNTRRGGDKRAFERELETLREALAQNEKDLEDIQRRCKVGKF